MKKIIIGLLSFLFLFVAINSASAFGDITGNLYYKDYVKDRNIFRVKILIYAYEILGSSVVDQDQIIATERILSSANQAAEEMGWKPVPMYSSSDFPEIMIPLRFSVDASRNDDVFYRHMYFLRPNDRKAKQKLRGNKSLIDFCKEAFIKYEQELNRTHYYEKK